jgi:hypothetical protein
MLVTNFTLGRQRAVQASQVVQAKVIVRATVKVTVEVKAVLHLLVTAMHLNQEDIDKIKNLK